MIANKDIALRNLKALIDFGEQITSNLDLKFTLDNLLFTLLGKLLVGKGIILIKGKEEKYSIEGYKGIDFPNRKYSPTSLLKKDEIREFQNNLNLNYLFELRSEEKSLGFVLLGKKLTNEEFTSEDLEFAQTIINIASAAVNNVLILKNLSKTNRILDSKINQLNSLFDLAKEFTGIFDKQLIGKTFVYTVLGQFMVSKYAIVSCRDGLQVVASNFEISKLEHFCKSYGEKEINAPLTKSQLVEARSDLIDSEIELVVPMQVKEETKGLLLLGKTLHGGGYSKSDIEFIYSAASLAIISLENSRLFEEYLQKQKMEKDLEVARKIQQNLLPTKFPKINNYEIEAFNLPARQVGGDYYDILRLDDDRILIVIADVSGKGMQAALLMANIQAFIKTLSKLDYPLNKATDMLNNLVNENTTNGSFITMFWGILNDKTLKFEFVNAGHNPPLLVRENEIEKLKTGGLILGVMETVIPYESETVQLFSNDVLLLFTDGITEAMDKDFKEFGEDKLSEIILEEKENKPLQIKNKIIDEIKVFTEGAPQSDDITMIIIKTLSEVNS